MPPSRLAFNAPSSALDLYTPRYVRGTGGDKVGLCPICVEPIERGGEGTKMFAKTKVSAYSTSPPANLTRELDINFGPLSNLVLDYHLQYYHGISSKTGLPFSPPLEFRTISRDSTSLSEEDRLPGKPKSKSNAKTTSRKKMMEGRCHSCHEWIALQGTKDVEVLVKELYW